jgi:hypothetical protein
LDVGFRVVGLADPPEVKVGLRVVGLDNVIIVGLRVVGLYVGFRVVGALVIDDVSPPPQTQHAMFAVTPA